MKFFSIFTCFLIACNVEIIFSAKAKQETTKHKIYSVCEYYENNGDNAKRAECVACFNGAFNGAETPSEDALKECITALPERFAKTSESENVTKSFIEEVLVWREEERKMFAANFKDILSFKEIEKLGQITASFVMVFTMSRDLSQKTFDTVLAPIYQCIEPGIDLKKFDNEVFNEEDAENMVDVDENKMMRKGDKIARSVEEASIRVRVSNMYKRVYSIFVCCINRIGEDKTAAGIVKDYIKGYYGVVPAKVARDSCKW